MAPLKKKKKHNDDSKSTSKQVIPEKTPLKNRKKTVNGDESIAKQVVVDVKPIVDVKPTKDDKKGCDAGKSIATPVVRKPCTWLKLDKLDPQIGSKSSAQNSNKGKETKPVSQIQTNKDNKRKRIKEGEGISSSDPNSDEKHINSSLGGKGKGLDHERLEESKKRDEKSEKTLGGLIFMCNSKTKPDCFSYQIMGVPTSKKEVVLGIKLGLKLFLYDYDLKLMYGIYEASSAGGMKIEPAAFGGGFPAQVRFTVHKDCLPLPESVFQKAIKDNYDKRTRKFDTQLSVKQVKRLTELFQPAAWHNPSGKPFVRENDPIVCPLPTATSLLKGQRYLNHYGISGTGEKSTPLEHEKQFSGYYNSSNVIPSQEPLFLTEQEYRSYGLQQGKNLLATTAGVDVSHNLEANKFDREREHLLRNPATASSLQNREANQPDPCFPSEKEYRFYGLRGPQKILNAASSITATNETVREYGKDACNPYDESTNSLVNRYLTLPRTTAIPAESYLLSGGDSYINNCNHTIDIRTHPRVPTPVVERPFAPYSLCGQSDLSQMPYSLYPPREPCEFNQGFNSRHKTDLTSAPVSHRYSFPGPSLSEPR